MDERQAAVTALLEAAVAINGGGPTWDIVKALGERLRALRDAPRPAPAPSAPDTAAIVLQAQETPAARPQRVVGRMDDVRAIFGHWQRTLGHEQAKLTNDRIAKIQARLREGYTVEDCIRAIDGIASSAHHTGQNDTQTRYDSIELIFRNGSNVERFRDMAPMRHVPAPVIAEMKQRSLEDIEREQEIERLEAEAKKLLKEGKVNEYAAAKAHLRSLERKGQ